MRKTFLSRKDVEKEQEERQENTKTPYRRENERIETDSREATQKIMFQCLSVEQMFNLLIERIIKLEEQQNDLAELIIQAAKEA